jgi:hypothetical protein
MAAVTSLRLLARAPFTVSFLPLPLRAWTGRRLRAARQIIGGQAVLVGETVFELAVRHHFAAMDAGAGAHVDDVVGGADGVFVMLDDEDGVAEIAEALEGDEQAVVVALVEADRRLVEDVEDARQAGADLAGEADALALAAGQGAGGAVEVQIFEADIVEEAERSLISLRMARAISRCCGFSFSSSAENQSSAWRTERREDMEMSSPAILTLSGSGRRRAPWQVSHGAADLVFGELLAHPGALGLEHAAIEVADHAFERLLDVVALAAVDEGQGDGLAVGAVEDDVALLVAELVPGGVELEIIGAGEAAEDLHVIRAGRVGLGPGDDGALLDREILVGDDELGIEEELLAEAVAGRAGALGGVEREERGSISAMVKPETGQANFSEKVMRPGVRWRRALPSCPPPRSCRAKSNTSARALLDFARSERFFILGRIGRVEVDQPLRQLQRLLERVREARFDPRLHDDAIDHDLDVVLVLLVERGGVLDAWNWPSMRTRVKPARCHSASSLRYSPLRPRTAGASRYRREPSGKAMMRSTIWLTVWALIGRPVAGL